VRPAGSEQVYSERADSQDVVGLAQDVVAQPAGSEQVYSERADSQDVVGLLQDVVARPVDWEREVALLEQVCWERADSRDAAAALVGLERALQLADSPRAWAERPVVPVPVVSRALWAQPGSLRELPAWFLVDALPWRCSDVAAFYFQYAFRWSQEDALSALE